jgi:hypothetical protein
MEFKQCLFAAHMDHNTHAIKIWHDCLLGLDVGQFAGKIIFNDETTFCLSGNDNQHDLRIWQESEVTILNIKYAVQS